MIDFHFNESSWCSDNILPALEDLKTRLTAHGECLCDIVQPHYLREATAEDEADQYLSATDSES